MNNSNAANSFYRARPAAAVLLKEWLPELDVKQ